jgi:hypothetical protein
MDKERSLQFNPMVTGCPITAICTACGKEFYETPSKTHDEIILRIRAEFAQHRCAETRKSNGKSK